MLEVGNTNPPNGALQRWGAEACPVITHAESQIHFGLWCVTSAPLIISHDVTNATMTAAVLDLLTNSEAIAVNQRYYKHPGWLVKTANTTWSTIVYHGASCDIKDPPSKLPCWQVWAKTLAEKEVAVLVANYDDETPLTLALMPADLGLAPTAQVVSVRDVWGHKELTATDALMYRLGVRTSAFRVLSIKSDDITENTSCVAAETACAKDRGCQAFGVYGNEYQLHGCADAAALTPNDDWRIFMPSNPSKTAWQPVPGHNNVNEKKCKNHPSGKNSGNCKYVPPPAPPPPPMPPTPLPYKALGSIDVGTGESSIFLFKGTHYLLDNIFCGYIDHFGKWNATFKGHSYVRIRELETGTVIVNVSETIATDFVSAFVDHRPTGDVLWLSALEHDRCSHEAIQKQTRRGKGRQPQSGGCGTGVLAISTTDLHSFNKSFAINASTCNTEVADVGTSPPGLPPHKYVMILEPYTFMVNNNADGDLTRGWVPATGSKEPHSPGGGPSIRWEGGHYYVITGGRTVMLCRSADLGASDPWDCTVMVKPTGRGGATGPGDGAIAPYVGFAKDAARKDFAVMENDVSAWDWNSNDADVCCTGGSSPSFVVWGASTQGSRSKLPPGSPSCTNALGRSNMTLAAMLQAFFPHVYQPSLKADDDALTTITTATGENENECVEIHTPSTLVSNTARIQAALDNAPAVPGGGCVNINAGDWYVGGVTVRSNTTFRILPGARLVSKINVTQSAVVQVSKAEHVTIEGGGGIYGSAEEAWEYFSAKDARMSPFSDDGTKGRPHTLLIANSKDVTIRHLFLHNSTDWTFRMDSSQDIWCDNIDIYGDDRFPNNDGFDPENCVNVTLINSRIDVADDGVCPKGSLSGLLVQNTTIRSRSGAIKFGSNTGPGVMKDIVFNNLTIWSSNGGMKIQARGSDNPSEIINVTWSNIRIETEYHAPRWWGNGEWLGISNSPRNNATEPGGGKMSHLRFINITGRSENGGLLSGVSGGVSDVLFENVHIKIATWSNYSKSSGGHGIVGPGWPTGVMCQQDPVICAKDTEMSPDHPMCLDQGGVNQPKPGQSRDMLCMGTHDYRPHDGGDCSYYCRTPSKAHGIFVENAHGVVLKNVSFEFESPRQAWFGDCVKLDNRSTGIVGVDTVKCINGPSPSDFNGARLSAQKNDDSDSRYIMIEGSFEEGLLWTEILRVH